MKKKIIAFLLYLLGFSGFGQAIESNAIDSLFAEWNTTQSPGCALGIMRNGQLIYSIGYGMANLEYTIPNSDSTVFRIGSTSKQFTAACIILLVEQGRLTLDETLQEETISLFKLQEAKGTSMVDCSNVVIMRAFDIPFIFSFDKFYAKHDLRYPIL